MILPFLPDTVNGCFECLGGLLVLKNCQRLYGDKQVKGVAPWVTAFFTAWGLWNIFYYPYLDQWLSFVGGLVIVAANFVWLAMAVYYAERDQWLT